MSSIGFVRRTKFVHQFLKTPNESAVVSHKALCILRRQIIEPMCQIEKVSNLGCGSQRDRYEVPIVVGGASCASFNKVCCHGNRGSTNLSAQTEPFIGRKNLR